MLPQVERTLPHTATTPDKPGARQVAQEPGRQQAARGVGANVQIVRERHGPEPIRLHEQAVFGNELQSRGRCVQRQRRFAAARAANEQDAAAAQRQACCVQRHQTERTHRQSDDCELEQLVA